MAHRTDSDIDEDLTRMERDIRQLKIEYEQYFGGGRKRPPSEVEWRIDQLVKRYGDRGAEMNYGQRFRYSNLTQTYSKYREIFHKRLRRREEGSVERHFGAAARAIQAERERSLSGRVPGTVTMVVADPEREAQNVSRLYEAYREALASTGEADRTFSRDRFAEFVRSKSEQLRRQAGGGAVEFVVSVERGKARLKARVKG